MQYTMQVLRCESFNTGFLPCKHRNDTKNAINKTIISPTNMYHYIVLFGLPEMNTLKGSPIPELLSTKRV